MMELVGLQNHRDNMPLRNCSPPVPLSPADTDCLSPGPDSPDGSSGLYSPPPPSPPVDMRPQELRVPSANMSVTNFCIAEILKPEFGKRGSGEPSPKSDHSSAFAPWNTAKQGSPRQDFSPLSGLPHPALGAMFSRSLASLGFTYDLATARALSSLPLQHSWAGLPHRTHQPKSISPRSHHNNNHKRYHPYSPKTFSASTPESTSSLSPPISPALTKNPVKLEEPRAKTQTVVEPRVPQKEKTELESGKESGGQGEVLWPAWVYCTRYSDRPSSGRRTRGPRSRKMKRQDEETTKEEKRPRTAFSNEQLAHLKREFEENRYLTEERRQKLAAELNLNESQIKIWFQNKRAKMKKSSGHRNGLALQLMAQGLYNHSTVPVDDE